MHEGVEQLAPVRIFDLVDRPGHRRLRQVGDQNINLTCSVNQCLAIFLRAHRASAAEDLYTIRLKFFSDGRAHIGVDAGD